MSEKVGLTPKQTLALTKLLSGATQADAAQAAGVNPRQVIRWLAQEDFKAALREGQAALLAEAGRKLLAETAKSIEVLAAVRDDAEAGPGPRVRAADLILTHAFESYERGELEDRIAELERQMNDAQ